MYIDKNYIIANTQHKYIKDLAAVENSTVVEEAIQQAQDIVENFTKQKFIPHDSDLIILNGNGMAFVKLPYHINEVTGVKVDDTVITSYDYEGYTIKLYDALFTGGFKNVIINGSFGWEEVPNQVVIVMKKLVEFLLLSEADTQSQAAFFSPYKNQSVDGASYGIKDNLNYRNEIQKSILQPLNTPTFRFKSGWGIGVV